MSITEIETKARKLQELKRLREELDAEITLTEDAIKAAMGDAETLTAGPFRISWKSIASSRIDTTALKRVMPEVAAQFTRVTTTRRFIVA